MLAPEPEFTSLLFPFLAQAERGVEVTVVPLSELADRIDDSTDVVAVSAVQSSTGELADLDAIEQAAKAHDALTVIDATHAIGWLPLDATRFDALVCAAYKWLMSPRGTAFMVRQGRTGGDDEPRSGRLVRRGEPADRPVRAAAAARAHARAASTPPRRGSAGSAPSRRCKLINEIGVETIHEHDLKLANRFREGLGQPPGDSAIVTSEIEDATEKLAKAGIMAAARAGRLRASFHVYNTERDVDEALSALSA